MTLFFLPLSAFSDELQLPFSAWPQDLKEEFAKTGRKLDLKPDERTEESWGYILNEGASFKIFTYHSATQEDFEIIKNLVSKIELAHKDK